MESLSTGVTAGIALGVDVADTAVASAAVVGDASAFVCITVGLLVGTSIIEAVGITVTITSVLINSLLPG